MGKYGVTPFTYRTTLFKSTAKEGRCYRWGENWKRKLHGMGFVLIAWNQKNGIRAHWFMIAQCCRPITMTEFLIVTIANWLWAIYQNNVRNPPNRSPRINHTSSNSVISLPLWQFWLHERASQWWKHEILPLKFGSHVRWTLVTQKNHGRYFSDGVEYRFSESTYFGKDFSQILFHENWNRQNHYT